MAGLNAFKDYIVSNQFEIYSRTYEHLWLTFLSLLIAVTVGITIGILLTRFRRLSSPVLVFVNIIQTIPSVALLGFLLPIAGIGAKPAIIALFLYSLLPIVRNTFTGITEVDPAVIEAATGMGLTNGQILMKVELPLAIPTIFAGIRTATVINVGVATLCALIASGGLGEFIFRGIALNNVNMIFAGAIPAALLAITLDAILGRIQKHIHRMIKFAIVGFTVIILSVVSYGILGNQERDEFTAGFTAEFMERPDGYPGLKESYDLELETVEMDPGLMYLAIRNNKVDVISGYSTDGRIEAFNLKTLKDDKGFFPPYYCAPTIHKETLEKYPVIEEILNKLAGKLSNNKMRDLNYQVDEKKKEPMVVARNFLKELDFKTEKSRGGREDITIGTKNFTEQYILARMFEILIENYSSLVVEVKAGLGGTKISFDALRQREIDIYPEYTGTSFLTLLNADKQTRDRLIRDKEAVYNYVKKHSLKRHNIVWLKPIGFNNTYALIMREDDVKELNLKTISDLKAYLESK